MKKRVLLSVVLSVFLISPAWGRERSPEPAGQSALIFHPLGFLQMGPIIEGQLGITDTMTVSLYWRYRALGLLDQLITTELFSNDMTWTSMAFGTGLTFYPWGIAGNSLYFGFLLEYYFGGNYDEVGTILAWEGFHQGVGLVGRAGFHLYMNKNWFMNLGVIAGAGFSFERYWEYTNYSGYTAVYGTSEPRRTNLSEQFIFIGMLEVSIGYLF